jgi:hypothetical protein
MSMVTPVDPGLRRLRVVQLGIRPDVQLRHDIGAVTHDRALVDAQVGSDLLVQTPTQHLLDHTEEERQ